ncbi:hypothetical protein BH23GEM11_BH23GEM11_16780 [soil metagenome]
MNRADRQRAPGVRRTAVLLLMGLGVTMAGCDFEVTNPGPIQEGFLDEALAQPAVVNGMGRALAQGMNWLAYTGAAVSREIHPAGSTAAFGIANEWAAGQLDRTDRILNTHWEQSSRARWLAESGVARMLEVGVSPELLTQGRLWAGYANRLMGEHYCEAVIDGGSIQPRAEYLNRAEQFFTEAIESGTGDRRVAALAGRASIRMHLGNWAGAAADAAQVPIAFDYRIPYYSVGSDDQRNRIAWASTGTPYKAHTVWNTVYEQMALSPENPSGDPRVEFSYTPGEVGDAAINCCGPVPFKRQRKHATDAAAIRLSSGREMRLVEAEVALIGDNWQGALQIINQVRAHAGVSPVQAANAAETWTRLKRERGIELWLEGRRIGDLYRWDQQNRPGEFGALETPGGGSNLERQDLCFPIPPSERETNPNVPLN